MTLIKLSDAMFSSSRFDGAGNKHALLCSFNKNNTVVLLNLKRVLVVLA